MRKKPMSREPLPILRKNPSQAWLLVGTLAYEEAEAARSDHLTQEPELFERERGRLKKRSKGFFTLWRWRLADGYRSSPVPLAAPTQRISYSKL